MEVCLGVRVSARDQHRVEARPRQRRLVEGSEEGTPRVGLEPARERLDRCAHTDDHAARERLRAELGIAQRAAPERDHATPALGEDRLERGTLVRPECSLAVALEDRRDGLAGPRLDRLVEVDEGEAERGGGQPPDRRLATAGRPPEEERSVLRKQARGR